MEEVFIDVTCRHCTKTWRVPQGDAHPDEWNCPWCGKTTPHHEIAGIKGFNINAFLFPKRYIDGPRADYYHLAKVLYFVDDETFWKILYANMRRNIPEPDEMPEAILIDNKDTKHAVVFIREGAHCLEAQEKDGRCRTMIRDYSDLTNIRRCQLNCGHDGECDYGE